eukprot:scaffold242388_cov37-Prasinocladus_malaysianus.AAC.1
MATAEYESPQKLLHVPQTVNWCIPRCSCLPSLRPGVRSRGHRGAAQRRPPRARSRPPEPAWGLIAGRPGTTCSRRRCPC